MSQEKDKTISFRLSIAAVVAIEQLIKGTDKTLGSYCKHLVLESLGLSDGESTQTAKRFEDVLASIIKRIERLEHCMQLANESVNNTVDNEESSSQLLVNESANNLDDKSKQPVNNEDSSSQLFVNELVNESADSSASGNGNEDEDGEVLTDITQIPTQIEATKDEDEDNLRQLTKKEQEIKRQLLQGYTRDVIIKSLKISPNKISPISASLTTEEKEQQKKARAARKRTLELTTVN
jgi:DNA-binding NarL/FixJ family response regulator